MVKYGYMRPIPSSLKNELSTDPEYKTCARASDGGCDGRITWEHAIIYAGRQLNERWAILPLCAYHHAVDEYQDGGDLNKEKNEWLALTRATDAELRSVSKAINYIARRDYLTEKYAP